MRTIPTGDGDGSFSSPWMAYKSAQHLPTSIMCFPHQHAPVIEEPPVPLFLLEQLAPIHSLPKNNKKHRVRFSDDETNHSEPSRKRPRHTIIAEVERCQDLPDDRRRELWIDLNERQRIRDEANHDAAACRRSDHRLILKGQSHFSYSSTYANLYAVCHLEIDGLVSAEVLTLMACNDARGLEDRTAPSTAMERRLVRGQQIKLVLQAVSRGMAGEKVARVASTLSRSSVRFAETMGMVDATAAMMVYTEMDNNDEPVALEDATVLSTTAPPSPPSRLAAVVS